MLLEMARYVQELVEKDKNISTGQAIQLLKERYGITEEEAWTVIDTWSGEDYEE
jgi:hypothetical protein